MSKSDHESENSSNDNGGDGIARAPRSAVLRRRWQLLIPLFTALFLLLLWRLHPEERQYIVTATLLLSPKAETSRLHDAPGDFSSFRQNPLSGNVNTHVTVLTNPVLIARALSRLKPQLRGKGWRDDATASASVTASSPDSQNLIELAVRARDRESAAALSASLIEVAARRMEELDKLEKRELSQLLTRKMRQVQALIRQAKQEDMDSKPVKPSSTAIDLNQSSTLQSLERIFEILNEQNTALRLALDVPVGTPSILTVTTEPDPTARTWTRAILISALCAFGLVVLLHLWLEQLNPARADSP